jgi:hypothetical protein
MFSIFHFLLHGTVLEPHEVLALNEFYPKVIHSLILIATPTHYDLIHSDKVEEGVKTGIIIYHQQDNLKIIIRTAQYKKKKGLTLLMIGHGLLCCLHNLLFSCRRGVSNARLFGSRAR